MKKLLATMSTAILIALAVPAAAFAHVVITPSQANVGDRVLFNISVPNEKQVAVSSIKLNIPNGLQDVQPDVAAGWDISINTDNSGDVTAITWTGTIPVGQRADLTFKAQAPAKAGELDWKAYQTYADGTVVHWDQKPTAGSDKDDDNSNAGPYSVTKVVNDLNTGDTSTASTSNKTTLSFVFSIAALALSLGNLFMRHKR